MENQSVMRVKTGIKYLYKGNEVIIVGYDYDPKEIVNIYDIEAVSYLLTSKELKDYLYYESALVYDINNEKFFYFCAQGYAKLEEIGEMEDFDVYLTKLKMVNRDFFQIVSVKSQEYMDKEFNGSYTDTLCILKNLYKKSECIKKLAKRAYQKRESCTQTKYGELTVRDGFYVLTCEMKTLSLPATKENYYILYALGMVDCPFQNYFMNISRNRLDFSVIK